MKYGKYISVWELVVSYKNLFEQTEMNMFA